MYFADFHAITITMNATDNNNNNNNCIVTKLNSLTISNIVSLTKLQNCHYFIFMTSQQIKK